MPTLKTRNLFISHAWSYDAAYNTVVSWLNSEPNFLWRNYSVPSHDMCEEKTLSGLKLCLTRQISPASGVIVISGMYAAYSDWIDYEIDEAVRLGKIIIGIKPWGQERVPLKIQNAATVMVGWNSASLISAVRDNI